MMTQKQISLHLDLDQSNVSRLLGDLGLTVQTATLEQIRVAYIRKLRSVAAGHTSHSGMDLTHERVMTERVDRELKELTLAEKRGQLVNLEQLEPELAQMIGAFRTELSALGDRLKTEIDALYGIDLDAQLIEEHIRDTLAQLARYDPERAGARASSGEAAGAIREAVHDGLGASAPEDVEQGVG